jgi:glucokinase
MKNIAIGVDVGGSHISCMGFDLDSQQLLPNTFFESYVDSHAMPDTIIKTWCHVIKQSIEKIGLDNVSGIGFAMPGPFDYINGISCFNGQNGKYENTYGMNVKKMLTDFLNYPKNLKIRFINDATAFALGEDRIGKARVYKRSLSITLGTGFGSAFIKNGLPLVKGFEVPEGGCLWHLPFENGVADDYFSTRGLLDRFEKKTGNKCDGVKDIVALYHINPEAKELFEDFGKKMGLFLHPWIEKSKIETLVLGGNISRSYNVFGSALQNYFNNNNLNIKVSVSELRENAAFIGSAILIEDGFYQKVLPVLENI